MSPVLLDILLSESQTFYQVFIILNGFIFYVTSYVAISMRFSL